MEAQYRLYALPGSFEGPRRAEDIPKGYSLLDCIIAKAISEATAGKAVYLLAMGTLEQSLWRRILTLQPDIIERVRAAKGKLHICAPRVLPSAFDVPRWINASTEEGATVIISGADMIYSTYMAAVRDLKKAQEKKNCEIIFAWRDEEVPIQPPAKFFEAWDELNAQYEKPIPPHTPYRISKEKYFGSPHLMHDPLLLYCPAREMAYRLDPADPQDKRLLDAFNGEKRRG
jgi:hypothetical protein